MTTYVTLTHNCTVKAEAEYHYRAFHTIWIRVGLSDPTAFCLSLASATIFLDKMKGRTAPAPAAAQHDPEGTTQAGMYYSRAVAQLSRRLADPRERLSLGVIATVVGCLCHDVSVPREKGSGEERCWESRRDGY